MQSPGNRRSAWRAALAAALAAPPAAAGEAPSGDPGAGDADVECTALAVDLPRDGAAAAAAGCEDGSRVDLLAVYTDLAALAVAARRSEYLLNSIAASWGPCPAGGECPFDLDGDGAMGVTDLLIVLAQWNSEAHVRWAIEAAVARANQAYVNSKVGLRLELVHLARIDYDEPFGCSVLILQDLQDPDDGVMDEVHVLRDAYHADLVTLAVGSCGGVGLAFVMGDPSPAFEAWAFSMMGWVFWVPSVHLLTHEIGHNMGCCHAYGDGYGCSDSGGAFPYSHGHRFPAGAPGYRTLMAYPPGQEIPYFSNPDVLYDGHPTGVAEGEPFAADNARTIRETAAVVANFRPSCP